MRYFIKRTASAEGTVFSVLDGLSESLYSIKTVRPFSTYRLRVENSDGVAAKIVSVPLPAVRAYSVSCPEIGFRIVLNGDACNFHGVGWHIRGSITAKNYDIMDAEDKTVAAVASHCSVANALELNIFDNACSLPCICTAVCLNLAQTVDNLSVQPV